MTWALVIGSWVAVALVAGLMIGAMIRRAEVKDLTSEESPNGPRGAEPSKEQPSEDQQQGSRRARVTHGRHVRRAHPFE